MDTRQPVTPASSTELQATCLGAASLWLPRDGGDRELVLGPGKPLALLIYLHSAPTRNASREHLTDLLWADLDPTAARHALRQTLWYLRQRLGPDSIRTDNGDIALALDLECDRDDFVRAVTDGRGEDAAAIYAGHFLPDFAVPGGLEFEYWAEAERTRLRLMYLRSAESVVRQRLSLGHVREARNLAKRARDLNPLAETAWRLYLETLIAARDPVSAMAEADRLNVMFTQGERVPDPATRALLRVIQQDTSDEEPKTTAGGLVAELIGREREFSAIIAAWEATRAGHGMRLHVIAPPGLGKTRLLQDTAARLRAAGARVVQVRAHPGERHLPFGLAAELATELARHPGARAVSPASAGALLSLSPALSSTFTAPADHATGHEALRRRAIALAELIDAVADEGDVAVLIDDLHWADPDSRHLLDFVLPRSGDCRALVLTTSRPTPGTGTAPADILELAPLTATEIEALTASIAVVADPSLGAALPQLLLQATAGSPLLVLETLQTAMERGLLGIEDDAWTCAHRAELEAQLTAGSALRARVEGLARSDRWLLTLLAAAGLPLSEHLLSGATGRDPDVVRERLVELERRGFATRGSSGWLPSHDELADQAWQAAPSAGRAAAQLAIGTAMGEAAETVASLAPPAAQLLQSSGDRQALYAFAHRWVRLRRRAGDHRHARMLVAELLGGADPTLVTTLPLRDRLGAPRLAALAAAAILLGAVGAMLAIGAMRRPRSEETLVLFGRSPDSGAAQFAAEVGRSSWMAGDPLPVASASVSILPEPATVHGTTIVPSPDGGVVAFSRVSHDAGEIDVYVRDARGRERRLTSAVGDDKPLGWSPDGRFLLASSGRWQPGGGYELASIDITDGTTMRLTTTATNETRAVWSPDGTRIALSRQASDASAGELCVMDADGSHENCTTSTGEGNAYPITWGGDSELLLLREMVGAARLEVLDLRTRRVTALADAAQQYVYPSPGGDWIACYCPAGDAGRWAWVAFPAREPALRRPLQVPWNSPELLRAAWIPRREQLGYLDTIEIDAPDQPLRVGVRHLLTARGRSASGREVVPASLRWWVSDTATAQITDRSFLLALRPGRIVVHATAGGWRRDSLAIDVTEPEPPVTVLAEDWRGGLGNAWVTYETPRPTIAFGPDSIPGVLTNGDGHYASGVYSTRAFPVSAGLGIEVLISTPFTGEPEQVLHVALGGWLDDSTLAAWDHTTWLPGRKTLDRNSKCNVLVAKQSDTGGTSPAVTLRLSSGLYQAETRVAAGSDEWYRLRLQVFSDGTCGLAVNGRSLIRSRHRMRLDRPYRVFLEGSTVGTRLIAGPLEVWQGVRGDVDWEESAGR